VGHHGVVGPSQTGDGVEQDHHVTAVLDESLRLVDHHVGNLHVAGRGLVEGRGDHLGLHGAPHVGHLFRPLVDEQHDQVGLRVLRGDRVRDFLQDHRLASLRWRRDQAALALPDGCDQVDDAGSQVAALRLELELLFRIQGCQVVEEDLVLRLVGRLEVDRLDLEEREVALAFLRRADLAFDGIARTQVEAPDLRRRDVDVVRPSQVVLIGSPQEAEAVLENLEHAFGEDLAVLGGLGLQDREEQILLSQARGIVDLHSLCEFSQFLHRIRLQVANIDALRVVVLVREGFFFEEILFRGQIFALDGLSRVALCSGVSTPPSGAATAAPATSAAAPAASV